MASKQDKKKRPFRSKNPFNPDQDPDWRNGKTLREIDEYLWTHPTADHRNIIFLCGPDAAPVTANNSRLIAASRQFEAMLKTWKKEVMVLKNVDPTDFSRLVEFIYCKELPLASFDSDALIKLYQVAKDYQVEQLVSQVLDALKDGMTLETALPLLDKFVELKDKRLEDMGMNYILENLEGIFTTTENCERVNEGLKKRTFGELLQDPTSRIVYPRARVEKASPSEAEEAQKAGSESGGSSSGCSDEPETDKVFSEVNQKNTTAGGSQSDTGSNDSGVGDGTGICSVESSGTKRPLSDADKKKNAGNFIPKKLRPPSVPQPEASGSGSGYKLQQRTLGDSIIAIANPNVASTSSTVNSEAMAFNDMFEEVEGPIPSTSGFFGRRKPKRCRICNKIVTHKRNHHSVHYPGNFTCPYPECAVVIKRKDHFKSHIQNVHKVNETKN